MDILFKILGVVFGIAGLWAWVVIMMDSFEDEIWKGVLCLMVPIYCLYYGAVEFDHDKKWVVFLTYLLAGPLGIVFWSISFMK